MQWLKIKQSSLLIYLWKYELHIILCCYNIIVPSRHHAYYKLGPIYFIYIYKKSYDIYYDRYYILSTETRAGTEYR